MFGLDGAVGIHEQDVDGAVVGTTPITVRSSHGYIDDAVPIQVTDRRDGVSEAVIVGQGSSQSAEEVTDLLLFSHGTGRQSAGAIEVVRLAVALGVERISGVAVAVRVGVLGRRRRAVTIVVGIEVVRCGVAIGVGSRTRRRIIVSVGVGVLFAVFEAVAVAVASDTGRRQVQDVDRAAVRSAVVVERRADGKADHPVVIEIADTRDRGTEPIVVVQRSRQTARRRTDLLFGANRSVRIQQQHVKGSSSHAPVTIERGTHRNVDDAIVVKISQAGDRGPEPVAVVDRSAKPADTAADLLLRRYCSIAVQPKDVDSTSIASAVVVQLDTNSDIGDAVTINVTDASDASAETIVVIEDRIEAASGITDLLLGFDCAVTVEEQHVHRSSVASAVAVASCTHCDVDDSINIDVSGTGDRSPEVVVGIEGGGQAASRGADLLLRPDRTVVVQEQDVDRATVTTATVVIERSADNQISDPVAVDVSRPDDRRTEPVAIGKAIHQTAGDVADLLLRSDRSIGIHQEDEDSASVRATVVVPSGSNSNIDNAITIDIAYRSDRTKDILVVKRTGKSARRRADLPLLGHGCTGIIGGSVEIVRLAISVGVKRITGVAIGVRVGVLCGREDAVAIVVGVEIVRGRVAIGVGPRVGRRVTVGVGVGVLLVIPQTVAVGVEQQHQIEHIHRTPVGAAVIIPAGTHQQVQRPVTVEVTDGADGHAEPVAVGQRSGQSARGRRDLLLGDHCPRYAQRQQVYRTAVGTSIVVTVCADHEVRRAVAVDVAGPGDGQAEGVPVVERRAKSPCGVRDLLLAADCAVDVQQQNVDGPSIRPTVVVVLYADRNVRRPVTVDVTEPGHRTAERVTVVERRGKTTLGVRDLLRGPHRPISVQHQHIDRTAGRPAVVVTLGTDHQVDDSVTVDVADTPDGRAELVAVVERPGEAAGCAGDALLGTDGAVGVQEEHVDRPTIRTTVVVADRADGEVRDPVTVDVAEASHVVAEAIPGR